MKKISFKYLFFALRPKQWIKNFFIFLPVVFGKKMFNYPENLHVGLAFILFSLTASVVYLINDILDYKKDCRHPTKKLRPIASKKISRQQALITAIILGTISFIFSFKLSVPFGWITIIYFVFNLIYSKILKHAVIIDVFCLGAFFLLRVIAGGVVAQITISHWTLIMTILLALFLGFNKRRQELRLQEQKKSSTRLVLKKYNAYFIDQMIAVITSSVVIVYMLYTLDDRTVQQFGSNHLLYSTPFVYYGIFRYLYLIHKNNNDGDPTRALLSDTNIQINIILWVGVCVAVIYFGL